MKSTLLLCFLLVGSSIQENWEEEDAAIGTWKNDAAIWFINAMSQTSDNQKISDYVADELKLKWKTCEDTTSKICKFMVFIHDTEDEALNDLLVDLGNRHITDFRDKQMIALRFPEDIAKCENELDETTQKELTNILDYSAKATSADVTSMMTAAQSANLMHYKIWGLIVSKKPSSSSSALGFSYTIDEGCLLQYSYTTKWVIKFYGSFETKDDDVQYIALKAILDALTEDGNPSVPTNIELAAEVEGSLGQFKEDNFWIAMVSDASVADKVAMKVDDSFFTKEDKVEAPNFCGKYVQAAGAVIPIAADDENICTPGYMPIGFFTDVVNQLSTNSTLPALSMCEEMFKVTNVSLSLKPLVAACAHDKLTGLEFYLDRLCTYDDMQAGKSSDWKIVFYAILPNTFDVEVEGGGIDVLLL